MEAKGDIIPAPHAPPNPIEVQGEETFSFRFSD